MLEGELAFPPYYPVIVYYIAGFQFLVLKRIVGLHGILTLFRMIISLLCHPFNRTK